MLFIHESQELLENLVKNGDQVGLIACFQMYSTSGLQFFNGSSRNGSRRGTSTNFGRFTRPKNYQLQTKNSKMSAIRTADTSETKISGICVWIEWHNKWAATPKMRGIQWRHHKTRNDEHERDTEVYDEDKSLNDRTHTHTHRER